LRKRTDHNQREVITVLKRMGVSVHDTSAVGGGFPDLVCGLRGWTALLEVKNGERRWGYTPQQIAFHSDWMGSPIITVSSIEEAIKWARGITG